MTCGQVSSSSCIFAKKEREMSRFWDLWNLHLFSVKIWKSLKLAPKKGISRFGDKLLGTEEIFFDKSRLNLHIHAFKFDQISIIEVKVIAVQPWTIDPISGNNLEKNPNEEIGWSTNNIFQEDNGIFYRARRSQIWLSSPFYYIQSKKCDLCLDGHGIMGDRILRKSADKWCMIRIYCNNKSAKLQSMLHCRQ